MPVVTLNESGRGIIGAAARIAAGELTDADVTNFIAALEGSDLYSPATTNLPCSCIDGRPRKDGKNLASVNAAGGIFSLMVADMLTTQTFKAGETTAEYATNFLRHLPSEQFGCHIASSTDNADDSGCGAVDKMAGAVALIAHHGDEIGAVASALGITIDEADLETIIMRATDVSASTHFSHGATLAETLRRIHGEEGIEISADTHCEVVVVVNDRAGTTLNRIAVLQQFGEKLQAFNYDRWAMPAAITVVNGSLDESQRTLQLAAIDLYTVAAACVLCDSSMRGFHRI